MRKKVPLEKLDFIIASQIEEVMYCRQAKSYGGELVMQIFMILGYLNFSFSFPPVVAIASSMATMLAKEY